MWKHYRLDNKTAFHMALRHLPGLNRLPEHAFANTKAHKCMSIW